jgi:hypothetical protein
VARGLVAGSKIHVDASLVDANASLHSVKPSEAEVLSAIEQTSLEQIAKLDGDGVGRAALSKSDAHLSGQACRALWAVPEAAVSVRALSTQRQSRPRGTEEWERKSSPSGALNGPKGTP